MFNYQASVLKGLGLSYVKHNVETFLNAVSFVSIQRPKTLPSWLVSYIESLATWFGCPLKDFTLGLHRQMWDLEM